jgi:hypothetical protein
MGYKSKYTGAQVEEMLDNMLNPREVIHDAGFDNCHIAIADGFIEQFNGMTYVVPESRAFIDGDYDEVLATENYVRTHMPTEIATAPQKVLLSSAPANNEYMANIVYEWQGTPNAINIDALSGGDDAHDSVWTIRFGCTSDTPIKITPSVLWKDGREPAIGAWSVCELTFRKQAELLGNYLGEWKLYK